MLEYRQYKIKELLELEPWSAYKLANYFKVEAADIMKDLELIKRAIRPKKIEMIPATCDGCGFQLKDRTKLKAPTKCPKCKIEAVQDPLLFIK